MIGTPLRWFRFVTPGGLDWTIHTGDAPTRFGIRQRVRGIHLYKCPKGVDVTVTFSCHGRCKRTVYWHDGPYDCEVAK
jgi:hypothetical protein